MFGKEAKEPKQPKPVDATEFTELQSGVLDIKTVSEKRIHDIKMQLMLEGTHPWAASDHTQQVLAWSSIAYMTDRIAEIMAQETITTDHHGVTRLPNVVNLFVTELSRHSVDSDAYARRIERGDTDPTITLDTPQDLTILNHLPVMPEYPISELQQIGSDIYEDTPEKGSEILYEANRKYPYDRDSRVAGHITPEFVSAMIAATDEIQAYAYTLCTSLADTSKTMGDIPELYSQLESVIHGNYLDYAQMCLDFAKGKMINGSGNIPDDDLTEAYEAVYRALEHSGQAFTALHCPATFGPDWILERE